jgi:hypothetical protein
MKTLGGFYDSNLAVMGSILSNIMFIASEKILKLFFDECTL